MRFLIYGARGWIGQQFIQLLQKQDIDYVEGNVRVSNKEKLRFEILHAEPTHIISFIGRTHGKIGDKEYTTIDYLEQDGKLYENIRDNLFSPVVLAILSKQLGIHYTYLGTGCIFEYDEHHPYGQEINGFTEHDKPNFFGSSYSLVKGFTDELMHLFEYNVLNVRIRMPITDNITDKRNFITKIINYEKICSVPNSMTVLPDLLPILIKMMTNNQTGTINLCNPGLISHNEILEMYKEIVDPDFVWKNFTIDEQNKILDSGRSNNFMDTRRLTNIYLSIPSIKQSVRNIMHRIASADKSNATVDC